MYKCSAFDLCKKSWQNAQKILQCRCKQTKGEIKNVFKILIQKGKRAYQGDQQGEKFLPYVYKGYGNWGSCKLHEQLSVISWAKSSPWRDINRALSPLTYIAKSPLFWFFHWHLQFLVLWLYDAFCSPFYPWCAVAGFFIFGRQITINSAWNAIIWHITALKMLEIHKGFLRFLPCSISKFFHFSCKQFQRTC